MVLRYAQTLCAGIVIFLSMSLVSTMSGQTTESCVEEKTNRDQDETQYQICLRMDRMQRIFESPYVMSVHAMKGEHVGVGTGVVAKIDGRQYIVTNNHVVGESDEVFVKFSQGHEEIYSALVVGRDPAADLALLSVPILPRGIGLVTFGNKPRIGEEVYALGYPYGMRSVTVGFVNALSTPAWFYFLTQTPVNPGNSGGPLFNARHEMIGFNTAIVPGAMMSFTISMEYAQVILPRLTREKLVEHGAAGFSFADTWRILPLFFTRNSLLYPPVERGVMVTEVSPTSHAAKSGIRVGDMIMGFNNTAVKNAEDLDKNIFLDHHPDEEVTFTTKRGAQVFERKIKLIVYISPFARSNEGRKE